MKNRLYYVIAVLFLVAFVTIFDYGGCGGKSSSSGSSGSFGTMLVKNETLSSVTIKYTTDSDPTMRYLDTLTMSSEKNIQCPVDPRSNTVTMYAYSTVRNYYIGSKVFVVNEVWIISGGY